MVVTINIVGLNLAGEQCAFLYVECFNTVCVNMCICDYKHTLITLIMYIPYIYMRSI